MIFPKPKATTSKYLSYKFSQQHGKEKTVTVKKSNWHTHCTVEPLQSRHPWESVLIKGVSSFQGCFSTHIDIIDYVNEIANCSLELRARTPCYSLHPVVMHTYQCCVIEVHHKLIGLLVNNSEGTDWLMLVS